MTLGGRVNDEREGYHRRTEEKKTEEEKAKRKKKQESRGHMCCCKLSSQSMLLSARLISAYFKLKLYFTAALPTLAGLCRKEVPSPVVCYHQGSSLLLRPDHCIGHCSHHI
jgi:hypothetical protein